MSKFNSKLAGDVLRSIFTNTSEHHQSKWLAVPEDPNSSYTIDVNSMESGNACGTQACIAGWAALHAGWKVDVVADGGTTFFGRSLNLYSPSGELVQEGKHDVELKEEGQQLLGLTGNEAGSLFYTMDEKLAVARLYSKIKTGDLNQLVFETEERLSVGGYTTDDGFGGKTRIPSPTAVHEVYRQAQEEFSPALDVLKTLTEPVLESADK